MVLQIEFFFFLFHSSLICQKLCSLNGCVMNDRIMRGKGQVVDGDNGIVYTHKDLPVLQRTEAVENGI